MDAERELIIRVVEAENDLVSSVNQILQKYNLPFFLIEPVVEKIHQQILEGKAAELAAARARELTRDVGDSSG